MLSADGKHLKVDDRIYTISGDFINEHVVAELRGEHTIIFKHAHAGAVGCRNDVAYHSRAKAKHKSEADLAAKA